MRNISIYRSRRLRLTLLSSLLVVTILGEHTFANQQEGESYQTASLYRLGLSIGFNTFALGDVKAFYHDLLNVNRAYDVPITTQREFPGNLLLGVSILRSVPSFADVGLGSRYSWTRAFSSYEDYAGTIEVNSGVSILTVEGIIQHSFPSEGFVKMYAGLRGGIVFGWSSFTQDVVFLGAPDPNLTINLTGSGRGYTVEGTLGADHEMGDVFIGASLGYRYSIISEMNAELQGNGETPVSGTLKLEHDLSGVIAMIHIGFHL